MDEKKKPTKVIEKEPEPNRMRPLPRVKGFHMAIGLDLIGSKTSLSSNKNNTLIDLGNAIIVASKTSKRAVKIPYTNTKGMELNYEDVCAHYGIEA